MATKTESAPAAEFDAYCEEYDKALAQGLSLSGEDKTYFARGRAEWMAKRLKQLGFVPRRALDFGCGIGTATPYLIDLLGVESLIGVDISRPCLDLAARTHAARPARFLLCDQFNAIGEIDLAYTNGVFHHIPPAERHASLRQIWTALRPGGLFAFWENNPWNPGTRYVMSRIPFDRDAIMIWPRTARRMLRAAGFEIVLTDFRFFFPAFLRRLRWLEPWLRKLCLGGQYLVLGKKPE